MLKIKWVIHGATSISDGVFVVSALTAIAQQLLSDCHGYGIEALSSNQASEVNGNIFQVLLDNGFQDLALKGNFFRLNLRFWPKRGGGGGVWLNPNCSCIYLHLNTFIKILDISPWLLLLTTSVNELFMQVSPGQFKEAMENHPPRLMICSVEFLASEEVLFIIFEAVCIHFAGAQCTAGLSPCTSGKKTNCCNRWSPSENWSSQLVLNTPFFL